MDKKIIFKAVTGSRSYGTNIETSDTDYKGVYVQGEDEVLGFGYKQQIDVGKDEVYYEVRRFLELLQTGNPTVLELLFCPEECIVEISNEFRMIMDVRDKFLTKKCLMSFGGYAVAQIKKARGLDKKMNWEIGRVERKTPMDFCYVITPLGGRLLSDWLRFQKGRYAFQENYGVSCINNCRDLYFIYGQGDRDLGYHGIINKDGTSNDLRLSSIPKEESLNGRIMSYNKDGYIKHCKDYNQYTEWLNNRNTDRYVDVKGHGQQIDGKNLLHCRRLLDMAIEIATEKTIKVRRPNADYLLSIRRGEVKLDDIIEKAEEDVKGLDDLFEKSGLPDSVDGEFLNDLLLKIRKYGK